MIYLASPYSHKDPKVRHKRYLDVTLVGAQLFKAGFAVVTPITSSVALCKHGKLKSSWEEWKANDLEFLKCVDVLVVLKLEGWDKSIGVTAEIDFADRNNIPIFFVENTDKDIDRAIQLIKTNNYHLELTHENRR